MLGHRSNKVAGSLTKGGNRPARSWEPELIKVTDHIYSAINYGRANVLYVITSKSVVVIDTTESPSAARACLRDFRKINQLPVSHIIYTHFHGDHIRGAKAFYTPDTKVIAQKMLLEEIAKLNLLLPYNRRLTAIQFGFSLRGKNNRASPDNHRISRAGQEFSLTNHTASHANQIMSTMQRAVFIQPLHENGYVPPDITFDEHYYFEEGGIAFELYHAPGETFDQLIVWLPQEKVLFSGDLFYQGFPMLSSPMKPDRPVLRWADSLEKMRTFHAAYLVPSHNRPIVGEHEIDLILSNYSKAVRYVHDETVKLINEGLRLEDIRQKVKLPQGLAELPYLQPVYGSVEWAVNGIFRQYTGWYSFNPTDLKPNPRIVLCQALLEASGGAVPLLKRARIALMEGQNQLVLELTDIVLSVKPHNRAARKMRARALKQLGGAAKNGVERNIYLSAALEYASQDDDQKRSMH